MDADDVGTQQLLDRHLQCFGTADLDGIMTDYGDGAVVFSPDGPLETPAAIRAWYAVILDQFAGPGTTFTLRSTDVVKDTAHITWSAETATASFVFANDTFVVSEGKIIRQSSAAHVVPK